MSFFRRPDYRSDITDFIDQLKAANPNLESAQRAGRTLLWDKQVDLDAWAHYNQSAVHQQPYVYQTLPISAPPLPST
jgi:hypothetical protein